MSPAITLDIDENKSAWVDETRSPAALGDVVPLDSTVVDVAIIGGGFTGVSTAYHLSRRFPERRIVLVEARSLANGASGRNGGQMLNWIAGVDPEDPEAARRIYSATKEGIDGIEQI